jgi:hypothetical protein
LLPIYIPESLLAVSVCSRSALDSFSQISQIPCGLAVPFGFCCGGFSSTAGYVPGNEAQIRRPERLATTSRLIISSEARLRFYPRRSRKPCDFPEAKPFGFQRGRNSCNSRLLPLPNDASPYRLPLSSLVTMPVSAATG